MWAAPQVPDSIPALSVPVIVLGLLPIPVFPRRGFFVEKRREFLFKKPMIHKHGFQRTKTQTWISETKMWKSEVFRIPEKKGWTQTWKSEAFRANVEIRGFSEILLA